MGPVGNMHVQRLRSTSDYLDSVIPTQPPNHPEGPHLSPVIAAQLVLARSTRLHLGVLATIRYLSHHWVRGGRVSDCR